MARSGYVSPKRYSPPAPPRPCPPLTHKFTHAIATFRGQQVGEAVFCRVCKRTAAEVITQSPADARAFADWLRANPKES